jgi:cytochrome c-type protein NapB
MKKPLFKLLVLLSVLGGYAVQAHAEGLVDPMRGAHALAGDDPVPTHKAWERDRDPIPRDYLQQPPIIPHKIEGYVINVRSNKCLSCHSWANYKEAGATKISQSHFENRDRYVLANVSARRYFCTQCHVPQKDIAPLVGNTFEPTQTITGK